MILDSLGDWISFSILFCGIVDDLISKKIHNKLILILLPLAIISVLVTQGFSFFLYYSLPSFLVALAISLPLYFAHFFGGGDLKLLAVVSLSWTVNETFWSVILSLPLGLFFGFFRIIFQGQLFQFTQNLLLLLQFKSPKKEKLQTFPFSVVLLLGWLTYKALHTSSFL